MSTSYLSFSSYGFHSCDCTCVKCYSLGLLYNPIKYCKCKLPLESFGGLDFVVRSRRVECQCLHRYKKLPISLDKCRSFSQEVAQLVDGVIDDFEERLIVTKNAY